jgi:hypothetical protein
MSIRYLPTPHGTTHDLRGEDKAKDVNTAAMNEGRKRVIGIMAAILASLHMQTAGQLISAVSVLRLL